jgi:hypothetical protein
MVWVWFMVFNATFQQYFSYVVAVSFIGGGNRSTRRKPPTCRRSLTNFITFLNGVVEIANIHDMKRLKIGVVRSHKANKDRQYNDQTKVTKRQKQLSTKHYTENQRLYITSQTSLNPSSPKGKVFLLH